MRNQLQHHGHRVFTPTLTGLGERSHLLSADITLDTHISDVANLILWEDLDDVVLVGHSYAGWVISGVAERVLPRLASLVFLDAGFPEDGQTLLTDQAQPQVAERIRALWKAGVAGIPGPSAAEYGIVDAIDQVWVDSKLTDQPIGVYLSQIALSGARERVPRKTYVLATGYKSAAPNQQFGGVRDRLEGTPGWVVREIESSHDIMIDASAELVEFLLMEASTANPGSNRK